MSSIGSISAAPHAAVMTPTAATHQTAAKPAADSDGDGDKSSSIAAPDPESSVGHLLNKSA